MEMTEILEAAERLNRGLIAKATDGEYLDKDFKEDLRVLSADVRVSKMLPTFIRTSRTTSDFRHTMQSKYSHYKERREYINQELQPIFDYLDSITNGTDDFSANTESYELGDVIGQGGYGTVHRFHHKLLDCDFAIKIFDPIFVSTLKAKNAFFEKRSFCFD